MLFLQWLTVSRTNSNIGQILDISKHTAKNHMKRFFKKMDVSNQSQAVGEVNSLQIQA